MSLVIGLNEEDIYNFDIDSYGNVSCYIQKSYDIKSAAFYLNDDIVYYFDAEGKVLNIGSTAFMTDNSSGHSLKVCCFPNAKTADATSSRCFYSQKFMEELVLDRLQTLSNSILFACGYSFGGAKVYVNPIEETIDSGNPHPSLLAVRIQPRYRIELTPHSEIIDLTVTSITSNSVILNFSIPTSTNIIYKYEVWDSFRFLGWISSSGETFSGLTSLNTYNFKLVVIDEYYNRSVFSNSIGITTL